MPHADFEDSDDGSVSYVEYVEAKLHPVSSFVIVPLFAFVNTGVVITSESIRDTATSAIAWGIFIGLVIGKPLGILAASYTASKARVADLPEGAAFNKVVATGSAAGIGFTVALFIADLAFDDAALQNIAVVAVIVASVVSALISTAFFKLSRK
jgi:NhaA family Na+:H+ antiporter